MLNTPAHRDAATQIQKLYDATDGPAQAAQAIARAASN